MFEGESLSLDSQVTLLICSSLGLPRGADIRPFGPRGWARLAAQLSAQDAAPQVMLGMKPDVLQGLLGEMNSSDVERLVRLLERTGQLGFEIERLQSRGIWVRTIADADYPSRLTSTLGPDAPPVLFGAGEPSLLAKGGVAIIGSRDVDDYAREVTRRLATAVGHGGTSVVSGGARGVDQVAMQAAFEAGGTVVGALPEGIERRIRETTTRVALGDGLATLVSPYHPSAGFSAGAAMARNKIVYALADAAVVISSAAESGGTWAGAVEAMEAAWTPVLVRDDESAPAGNRALIVRGARGIDLAQIGETVDARKLVDFAAPGQHRAAEVVGRYEQQNLALTEVLPGGDAP